MHFQFIGLLYCGLKFEKKVQFGDAVFPQRLKYNLNAAEYPMSEQKNSIKKLKKLFVKFIQRFWQSRVQYVHLQFIEVKANLLTALFTYFFPIFFDINAHIGGMLFQEESIY